jgi:hypothetical protein
VLENNLWRTWKNKEENNLYNNPDIVAVIRICCFMKTFYFICCVLCQMNISGQENTSGFYYVIYIELTNVSKTAFSDPFLIFNKVLIFC